MKVHELIQILLMQPAGCEISLRIVSKKGNTSHSGFLNFIDTNFTKTEEGNILYLEADKS